MNPSSILILGNPNVGKSLLFNKLTGLRQKVANFPGVTVEVRSGSGQGSIEGVSLLDFPGLYSLDPLTRDEEVAVERFRSQLLDPQVKGVLCVVDATRLERSLGFALQLRATVARSGKKLVLALNMMDELKSRKHALNISGLANDLKVPVIGISARNGSGLEELRQELGLLLKEPEAGSISLREITPEEASVLAKTLSLRYGPRHDIILKNQNSIDRIVLSSWGGGLVFVAIMLFLFQAIFSWSAPLMDGVEAVLGWLGLHVSQAVPEGMWADFVNDALFGGIGSFLVFVPQIFVLTLIIGFLEDSGYLARATILCHKPLSYFGLSGKSFVPLLSAHACAIPAILSTRTIESPRRRLITLLTIPLTSCSARLPVYALLIAAFIPARRYMGGLLGLQGIAFFCLYFFGIVAVLGVSALLSKFLPEKEGSDAPFILELPPYRLPAFRPLIRQAVSRSWAFVRQAALVIFSVTVIVWVLGYFPHGAGHLDTSYLAVLGHWIDPLFSPLGMDWKLGVAILTSFLAREVFVGTLGTLYGLQGAEDNIAGLAGKLQTLGMSVATGLALLVFYAIALQCVSTLAVVGKETGSRRAPWLLFGAYTLLAYAAAAITYGIAHLFSR